MSCESHQVSRYLCSLLVLIHQVSGQYVNVALRKPARQKDDLGDPYPNGDAEWAVDGNSSPEFWHYTCSHTAEWSNPTWWIVDLLGTFEIHAIKLTNRNYAQSRLSQFSVYISNDNPLDYNIFPSYISGELCFYRSSTVVNTETILCTNPISGRYITVYKNYNPLTMCEFEALTPSVLMSSQFRLRAQNAKSAHSPFSTLQGISNAMRCVVSCMRVPGSLSSLVQYHRSSGECQCLQVSALDDSTTSIVSSTGWSLYSAINN